MKNYFGKLILNTSKTSFFQFLYWTQYGTLFLAACHFIPIFPQDFLQHRLQTLRNVSAINKPTYDINKILINTS